MTLEQVKLLVARATPTANGNPHLESNLAGMIEGITPYYYSDSEKKWGYFCDGRNNFVCVSPEDVASSLLHKIECVENLLGMQ
jgi:hypothetical protein